MAAVRSALDSEDENAIDFVDNVNRFLDYFGMNRDRKQLIDRAETIAGAVGSRSWFLSRHHMGEQLWTAGQLQAALDIFEEVLAELREVVSYERCVTLGRIGRCYESAGQSDRAAGFYRQKLSEARAARAIRRREAGDGSSADGSGGCVDGYRRLWGSAIGL